MKTFKEFLTETPFINDYHTKEVMHNFAKPILQHIVDNHSSATHLGNNHYHLVHKPTGANIYYHHDGNTPKEMSYINKDIQTGTDKNGGDVSHIHHFMNHHIGTAGKLSSDSSNTVGSKHLWKSFIKKNPQHSYHYHNSKTGEKTTVTPENIDHHEHKIWGTHSDFHNIKLVAEK